MNKKTLLLVALILVVTLVYYLWPKSNEADVSSDKTLVAPPVSLQTQEASTVVPKKKIKEDGSEPSEDPYANEAIRAQLLQVADLYAEASKYPHTSQPIRNPDLARDPKPFEETEVDTPFPLEDQDQPIRLLAAVDRYQYFLGDSITARLHVVGAPADTFVQAKATISGSQGDTPLTATLNPDDETLTSFTSSFDTRVAPRGMLSNEMMLKLQVEIGDETLFTTVPFRYAEAAAQLIAVPYARQEADNLAITLQYSVFQAGYYFVRAILEDARTGQPLLQLQGESRLNQGNSTLQLNAHISALRAMGSEGPYVLRSVQTHRGAEVGETYDVPASTSQARFSVPGFPFEQYDDIPYQDDQAAERLEFLESFGAQDRETVEPTQ